MLTIVIICVIILFASAVCYVVWLNYRKILREAKNYERALKVVPLLIHLPPQSDDIEQGGRDQRDINEEAISQAQTMYNVIASTATKGFKSKVYGQRHISFEIVASKGLIHYYAVVPLVLEETVKQAIITAYPSARLERVEEQNIFSEVGKINSTIGGELNLKKSFDYPIAVYQESKRDGMQSILNSLASMNHEDGAAIQIMVRPAHEGWVKYALSKAADIRKGNDKKGGLGAALSSVGIAGALWKPPESKDHKPDAPHEVNSVDQAKIEAIEGKTRHPGYEVLIRVITSSSTAARSQAVLANIITAFSVFDDPSRNGFKYAPAKNIENFVSSYIFRFFPQNINNNILNSVELATIFHLPDQKNTPTSGLQRQASKQVDGPYQVLDEGFMLGYNIYRGVKKPIRLGDTDRRRHMYMIGQTGTGKSKFLENLAMQDMLDGKGFAFIDPHGDSAEALLGAVPKERVEDVIYFNPGDMTNPIGLNMFEFDSPDQKDFLVQEAINMLYSLYDPGHTGIVGPRMEHIFRNCALLLMSDPKGGSFIDIPKLLVDDEFMKSKLKYVTDQQVLDFWTKEYPASQRSNESGEVTSWVVSKFGPFMSNEMMRNIIGQTTSGFNLREIMDNKKILLVNLSKGRMGELNSKLLGMIFVMKFQAAAMGRADVPEDQRVNFSLYVDEFQNFATESFESILSEARKYRLSLIVANQFMTQLTDKIREAIIGNVGTVVSGRIGVTDAELLVKKFSPVFDVEDITRLPNFEGIASVMIKDMPSSPFSISFLPPLVHPNEELAKALRRLTAAKFGKPRAVVEQEIFNRLRSGEEEKRLKQEEMMKKMAGTSAKPAASGGSFLDEWLAKRKANQAQLPKNTNVPATPSQSVEPAKNVPIDPVAVQPVTPKPVVPAHLAQSDDKVLGSMLKQDELGKLKNSLTAPSEVKYDVTGKQAHGDVVSAMNDTQDVDQIVGEAQEKIQEGKGMFSKAPEEQNHLQIKRSPVNGAEFPVDAHDEVDEIVIDVRGNIHHSDPSFEKNNQ